MCHASVHLLNCAKDSALGCGTNPEPSREKPSGCNRSPAWSGRPAKAEKRKRTMKPITAIISLLQRSVGRDMWIFMVRDAPRNAPASQRKEAHGRARFFPGVQKGSSHTIKPSSDTKMHTCEI